MTNRVTQLKMLTGPMYIFFGFSFSNISTRKISLDSRHLNFHIHEGGSSLKII